MPGVVRAVDLVDVGDELALVLEDIGASSLDRLDVPLPIGELLALASRLAITLDEVHERAVVGVQTAAGFGEGTPHGSVRR
jgi:IMP dehydrogenase